MGEVVGGAAAGVVAQVGSDAVAHRSRSHGAAAGGAGAGGAAGTLRAGGPAYRLRQPAGDRDGSGGAADEHPVRPADRAGGERDPVFVVTLQCLHMRPMSARSQSSS